MYKSGAKTGPSRSPIYFNKVLNRNSMRPSPVIRSRPNSAYFHEFMKMTWVADMAHELERLVLSHVAKSSVVNSQDLIDTFKMIKGIIPECLRICNTIFNSLVLVDDMESSGYLPVHL